MQNMTDDEIRQEIQDIQSKFNNMDEDDKCMHLMHYANIVARLLDELKRRSEERISNEKNLCDGN